MKVRKPCREESTVSVIQSLTPVDKVIIPADPSVQRLIQAQRRLIRGMNSNTRSNIRNCDWADYILKKRSAPTTTVVPPGDSVSAIGILRAIETYILNETEFNSPNQDARLAEPCIQRLCAEWLLVALVNIDSIYIYDQEVGSILSRITTTLKETVLGLDQFIDVPGTGGLLKEIVIALEDFARGRWN